MSNRVYNPHNGVYMLLTICASLLWKKRHHKRPSSLYTWAACAAAENFVIRIRSNGYDHYVWNVPKPLKRVLSCADLSPYEQIMAKNVIFGPKNAPAQIHFCKPTALWVCVGCKWSSQSSQQSKWTVVEQPTSFTNTRSANTMCKSTHSMKMKLLAIKCVHAQRSRCTQSAEPVALIPKWSAWARVRCKQARVRECEEEEEHTQLG